MEEFLKKLIEGLPANELFLIVFLVLLFNFLYRIIKLVLNTT